MNIQEIARGIRTLHSKNESSGEDMQKKIDLCFELLDLYCAIQKNKRTNANRKDCCYAALILSGVIQKGLGGRVVEFLKYNEEKLPESAVQILRANVLRMESF